MRVRVLVLGCVLFAVSFSSSEAQVQSKEARLCIDKLNLDGAAVALQQGKENVSCLAAAGKGKLDGSAEDCLLADGKGKVQGKRQKTVDDEAAKCGTTPDFAYAGSAVVNDAAQAGELGLMADLFGSPLDGAVIGCDVDTDACKCQQLVAKAAESLAATERTQFVGCKKNALKEKKEPFPAGAASAADVAACVDDAGLPASIAGDGKGKIATKVGKLADTIAKKCDVPGVTSVAFDDGRCAGLVGASLADCIDTLVACRVCQTIGAMDALPLDCDAFACGAFHGSATFTAANAPQTFTVPGGVTLLTIYAAGASGGNGGGRGGAVTATLSVTPGEDLVVNVGGVGGLFGEPGYNGGGTGGFQVGEVYLGTGGGGGGASDVRQGGSGLGSRVVVAAGGGGGMGGNVGVLGGDGGGLTGQPGCCLASRAGGGGTQSAGGAGGGQDVPSCAGADGALGVGGDGAFWVGQPALCSTIGGGAGGGGYYGGGGAGATGGPAVGVLAAAGGGGSSYTVPTATGVVHGLAPTPFGTVVVSW